MPIRTILSVAGLDAGDVDIDMAAELCGENDAHLSVLVIAFAAPPPISEFAVVGLDLWVQERHADHEKLRRRSAEISGRLAARSISTDLSTEYPEMAWADETIGRRARYADITLLGPELLAHATLSNKVIEGALFSSGKPLLIVPKGANPTLKPGCVMVAWDSRLEASRAVAQSLDLLRAADDVRLVLVDPTEGTDGHGAEPGADAATYLARHGVKVTVERLPSQGRTVDAVLKRHAVDCAADLVVMGAYGHSRLRERILGGVTRSMIDEPSLPIFLAR